MGVKIRQKDGKWYVFINHQGKRKAKCIGDSKRAAEAVKRKLEATLLWGDAMPRRQVPQAYTTKMGTRFRIFRRDDYRCRLCGVSARDGEHVRLEVDHITPRSQGGTNEEINLWTLCAACNRGKGAHEL